VAHWEDGAALFGGAPLGAGFALRMLAAAAERRWLRAGADVLLEVDSTHPALFINVLVAGAPARAAARAAARTASGFAAAAGGGRARARLLARAGALEHDWWPRRAAAGADKAAALAHATAQWRAAVRQWAPALRHAYRLRSVFTDHSGRPRFLHLTAAA